MTKLWKFLILGLSCIQASVIELGDEDEFHDIVDPHPMVIVHMYTMLCNTCRLLKPNYKIAARTLKDNVPEVPFIQVNCEKHKDICQEYEATGYPEPTIIILKYGVLHDDDEKIKEYTANYFLTRVTKALGSNSVELQRVQQFKNIKEHYQTNAIVGFFENESSPGYKAFKMAADETIKYKVYQAAETRFYYTFNKDVMLEAGRNAGDLIFYRPKIYDFGTQPLEVKYEKAKFTLGMVRNFAIDSALGDVTFLRGPEEQGAFGYPQALVMHKFDFSVEGREESYKWLKAVKVNAEKFAKKYDIKVAFANKNSFDDLIANQLRMDMKSDTPLSVIMDDSWTKFRMESVFDDQGKNFGDFLTQHNKREIEFYVKTEAAPEDALTRKNKFLTARNFEKIVNGKKDTFIKFYTPWCGHCRRIAPLWDDMVEQLGHNKGIQFAEMNIDENDPPAGFEIKGVPSIHFVAKGKQYQPQVYKGSRLTEDMVEWLMKNAGKGKLKLKKPMKEAPAPTEAPKVETPEEIVDAVATQEPKDAARDCAEKCIETSDLCTKQCDIPVAGCNKACTKGKLGPECFKKCELVSDGCHDMCVVEEGKCTDLCVPGAMRNADSESCDEEQCTEPPKDEL